MVIGGLQRFSLCDFPGKVAAVVFTQGCNFRCPFCHNGHLIPFQKSESANIEPGTLFEFLFKRKKQLDGVVISGGEPTVQKELAQFIGEIKSMGFQIKLDTNGSQPHVIKSLLDKSYLDALAMDIKAPFHLYEKLSGTSVNIKNILESIQIITQSGIPYEFRTTYVEKLLSSFNLEEIKKSLPAQAVYRVLPFNANNALDFALRDFSLN